MHINPSNGPQVFPLFFEDTMLAALHGRKRPPHRLHREAAGCGLDRSGKIDSETIVQRANGFARSEPRVRRDSAPQFFVSRQSLLTAAHFFQHPHGRRGRCGICITKHFSSHSYFPLLGFEEHTHARAAVTHAFEFCAQWLGFSFDERQVWHAPRSCCPRPGYHGLIRSQAGSGSKLLPPRFVVAVNHPIDLRPWTIRQCVLASNRTSRPMPQDAVEPVLRNIPE